MLLWKRFADIEWGERHEDICLEEGNEEFEKPKWKRENTECTIENWDLLTDEYHNRDQDHPDKNIQEKTHREWTNTDELSSKMQPSDKDADDLLGNRISMVVEEIVLELMEWSLESEGRKLREHNHCEGEDERCREIRIDRTEVCTEPLITRWEDDEVHHETEYIPEKNHNHKSSEEPDISIGCFHISEEWSNIGDKSWDNIEAKCFEFWETLRLDCDREKGDENKKNHHKNPCRKDCIRDMNTADIPIQNILPSRSGNMWSDLFCGAMYCFCLDHNTPCEIAGEYMKTRFFCKFFFEGNEKSSNEEI